MSLFGNLSAASAGAAPSPNPLPDTMPFPGGTLGPREATAWDTGRTWLVGFSGDLRNLRPLTEELRGRAIELPEEGPAAVLATLCEEIGFVSAVARLRGDFVAAGWDGTHLWLARDPSGARTLYYRDTPGDFFFTSNAGDFSSRVLDPQSLRRFLTYGYLPSPHTLWPGVRRLPAGACLRVSPTGTLEFPAAPLENNPQGFGDNRPRWARSVGAAVELMLQQRLSVLPEDVPVTVLHGGGVFSEALLSNGVSRRQAPVNAAIATFSGEDGAFAVAQARRWGAVPELVSFRSLPLPPSAEPLGDPLLALLLSLSSNFNGPCFSGLGGAQTFGVEAIHARLRRDRLLPFFRAPDPIAGLLSARGGVPPEPLLDAPADAFPAGKQEDPLVRVLRFDRRSTLPDGLQHAPLLSPFLDSTLSALLAQVPLGTLLPLRTPHGLFSDALHEGISGDRPRFTAPLPLGEWLAPHLRGLAEALEGWVGAETVRAMLAGKGPMAEVQRFRLVALAHWRRSPAPSPSGRRLG